MQLQIRPYRKNIFPIGGILVKSPSVAYWLRELQRMQLNIKDVRVYPIPGNTANTIWGCMVVSSAKIDKNMIGRNELCQVVSPNLFIPERAILFPAMSDTEIEKLFSAGPHIAHPEFGFVTLSEALDPGMLILSPTLRSYHVTRPDDSVFIPGQIKSFQLKTVPPEDVIKQLEEKTFPKKEKMRDKPLNIFEKGKLLFYSTLFIKKKNSAANKERQTEKTKNWAKVENAVNAIVKTDKWGRKLQEDFEDLDARNQNDVDKLMDLLRKNPEEALKYAIPLDNTGAARGGDKGRFSLLKRWYELSWTTNSPRSTSGSIDIGNRFHELQQQYNTTAEALMKQKKYHNAAFVYMKLLKNNHKAAEALEMGSHYQEAATVYLKHANNKQKAAECYEKGNMITDAIEIYEELNENEKVGDLYASISKRKEANIYYEKVVTDFKSKNQYVKAALICKNKMNDIAEAQSLLLGGWQSDKDAVNCLNNYFANILDTSQLKSGISNIYNDVRGTGKEEAFLMVIKHEYAKKSELSEMIKDMAYEIIAANIATNPSIVSELKLFNPKDNELIKDTLRFKMQNKK